MTSISPNNHWWLIRITLLVAFGFLSQTFGRWQGPTNCSIVILQMQVQCWGYHEVVETLKPYHMLNNLFELIALKGHWDTKTLGARAHAQVQVLALAH